MKNTIKFEIETEANYDDEEKDSLLDDFLVFMKGIDPDVIDGTESVEIFESDLPRLDGKNAAQDLSEEFLKTCTVEFTANVVSPDGTVIRTVKVSADE